MYYDPIAYAQKARQQQQEYADRAAAYRRAARAAEQDGYPHTAADYAKTADTYEMQSIDYGTSAVHAEDYAARIGP